MNDNPFNNKSQDGKPVNINISFNISRDKVTQNVKNTEKQESFNLKKNQVDEDDTSNPKSKNNFYRQQKTPQLLNTDRNNYSREFENIKLVQEMRKKKRTKRASEEFAADKTLNFPFYPNETDKPIMTHRRGHTTSFIKKSQIQTVTKAKKKYSKTDQNQKLNRTTFLYQNTKNQLTRVGMQKSIKGTINKLRSKEQSDRSLPQATASSKSKQNQSALLTGRKIISSKPTKKKSSKSQIITKEKTQIKHKRQFSDRVIEQKHGYEEDYELRKDFLLQKLGNFRSIENSLLVTEVDRVQEGQQGMNQNRGRRVNPRNRIVIKTDKSMQCLDEIHKFENYKFKQQFFNDFRNRDESVEIKKSLQTHDIIQTYIKILNQSDQSQLQHIHTDDIQQFDFQARTSSNRSICDKYALSNLNQSKFEKLVLSPTKKKQANDHSNKNLSRKSPAIQTKGTSELKRKKSAGILQGSRLKVDIQKIEVRENEKLQKKTQQIVQDADLQEQDQFRPYFSLQLGKVAQEINSQQRDHLTQLKRQEIQKWNYLQQYIKQSMKKQASSQQVLENVYQYLSQAKGNLIRQGKQKTEQISEILSRNDSNLKGQQSSELNESQLSVQIPPKSQIVNQQCVNQKEQSQKVKDQIQDKQILDEQIRSFKDEYESQDNDDEIKFMNLETIESALKNRLKILDEKKEKQLNKLQQAYEQGKMTQQLYEERKSTIERWFKNQTDEILSVKKSIWKGYNEAKGILGRFCLGSTFDEQHHSRGSLSRSNIRNLSRLQDRKDKKMLKCISESYLNNKYTKYKQFKQVNSTKPQQKQFKTLARQTQLKEQRLEHSEQSLNDINQQDNTNIQVREQPQQQVGEKIDKYEDQIFLTYSMQNSDKIQQLKEQQSKNLKEDTIKIIDEEISRNQVNEKIEYKISSPIPKQKSLKILDQNTSEVLSPYLIEQYSPGFIYYDEISKGLQSDSQISHDAQITQENNQHSDLGQSYDDIEFHESKQSQASSIQQENQSSSTFKQSSPKLTKLKKVNNEQQPLSPLSQHVPMTIQLSPAKKPTKLAQSFKYLTDDDKQDIFEFLFLDICIEFYQEPCHQNKIMNSINKFVINQHELSKRKRGVKTNLNVVKDYLKRLCGYLLRTNKKMLANVNVPMGPTAIEMLKYMHENDDIENQQLDDSQGVVTLIVPINIFDTFEKSLLPTMQFQKYYDDQDKEKERIHFLKNILHIHNKALFDALNQFLDHQRPFGIWGRPFPWKKTSQFCHKFTEDEQHQKLKSSAQKVVQSCSYVCGLLPDKEQSLIGKASVSSSYLQQIREDRMSRMLANEIIESEDRWVFYDDEETETLVQISNYICNRVMADCIGQIVFLKTRQLSR